MKVRISIILAGIFMVFSMTGCNDRTPPEQNSISLTFSTILTAEQIEQELAVPLQERFPHIAFQFLSDDSKGAPPVYRDADIRHAMLGGSALFNDYRLHEEQRFPADDLTPMLEESGFVMESVAAPLWQHAHALSSEGIEMLPYTRKLYGLFYDSSLLQQGTYDFMSGMLTWEQLALWNRTLPDEQKSWFKRWIVFDMMNQLSIPLIRADYSREEVTARFQAISHMLDTLKNSSDSYAFDEVGFGPDSNPVYAPSGTYSLSAQARRHYSETDQLLRLPDYQVTHFPYFDADNPTIPIRIEEVLLVNRDSPHRREAFEVIAYMLSEEFQLRNARNGLGPVLDDQRIYEQFGADVPEFQGKSLEVLFSSHMAPFPESAEVLGKPVVEHAQVQMLRIVEELLKGEINREEATQQFVEAYAPFMR
ncbi:hypothetical protein DUZ99_06780 [Xylanibacillus composti]|uniref:Carbohydrate ABC transporter substrate-binding protein n=1 Tax=Xylanibacillus composti TaxID=1572762 RepID=A0A8J4H4R5_9BACL|nr:hypothetical protein [Xylanibacillus composti]MDT9724697.1 hypothetical protein [Xylanibacillus composti]GIQ70982.1 hypothetical protein XYCOK13_38060 [Xylanibacillus composti]